MINARKEEISKSFSSYNGGLSACYQLDRFDALTSFSPPNFTCGFHGSSLRTLFILLLVLFSCFAQPHDAGISEKGNEIERDPMLGLPLV